MRDEERQKAVSSRQTAAGSKIGCVFSAHCLLPTAFFSLILHPSSLIPYKDA